MAARHTVPANCLLFVVRKKGFVPGRWGAGGREVGRVPSILKFLPCAQCTGDPRRTYQRCLFFVRAGAGHLLIYLLAAYVFGRLSDASQRQFPRNSPPICSKGKSSKRRRQAAARGILSRPRQPPDLERGACPVPGRPHLCPVRPGRRARAHLGQWGQACRRPRANALFKRVVLASE